MFRKIGLGGGGAKGILHIGVLRELSKHQKLYFPDGVFGCSIGSIIATFVAFEVPFDKILTLIQDFCCIDRFVPPISIDVIENAIPQKGAFDMKIFVDSNDDIRLIRRIKRDVEVLM
jgi:predicted patatin/cPLA2 family phospholipase